MRFFSLSLFLDSVLNLVPFYCLVESCSYLQDLPSLADSGLIGHTHKSGGTITGKAADKHSPHSHNTRDILKEPISNFHSTAYSHSNFVPLPSITSHAEIDPFIKALADHQKSELNNHSMSDKELFMLLFSVIESISSLEGARGTSRVSSTLRLLRNVTSLFEDVIGLWLEQQQQQQRNGCSGNDGDLASSLTQCNSMGRGQTPLSPGLSASFGGDWTYSGVLHLARLTLRLWLKMVKQVLHSSLQDQHLSEVQLILSAPLERICKTCYNLQQVGLFKGSSQALDHEFTLIILEGLFSALHVVNLFPSVPICQVSNFYEALRDTLTDSCQEWFAYLCSKLHGVSNGDATSGTREDLKEREELKEDEKGDVDRGSTMPMSSDWSTVLSHSYSLLTHILAELLTASSHIKSSQQATKLALVSSGVGNNKNAATSTITACNAAIFLPCPPYQHPFLFHRPTTYSLEVATGFDKLTFRLSKMAELLLSVFKEVPHMQLLSLRLLFETTKDMVGAIGSFLANISDPSIYMNSDVLDPYLDMLEEIWFRLSPDYGGSALWWSKLSNYSHLLMECEYQVVCQVIYHLQCLFSHESSTLKSELTSRVIMPYHHHLMELVKSKCYSTILVTAERETSGNDSSSSSLSSSTRPQVVKIGHEDDLEHNEKGILSLFLKLLIKVVSHPRSLGTFASSSTNLYSLFLLLPLNSFRAAGLKVLEECLSTIHRFRTSAPNSTSSSPSHSVASNPVRMTASQPPLLHTPQEFQRPDKTGIQKTLLQILLSVAYSVQISKIPSYCISIAEGRASLLEYGLAEVDQVHNLLMSTFEHSTINQLLTENFINHISIMADVWSLLARTANCDDSTADILRSNHIWDVVQVFGPSLANVLPRLHQRLSRDSKDLSDKETEVRALQECGASLLADLLVLAHNLCWQRRDQRVSVCVWCVECCIVCVLCVCVCVVRVVVVCK